MSVIPEYILQVAFINGFEAVRKDTRILDALFKNLPQLNQAEYKNFILNKKIDFSLNYPRTQPKVPGIVLLLKNETEGASFLGDVMGTGGDPSMIDEDLSFSLLGGSVGTTSDLRGQPKDVTGQVQVMDATESYLEFDPVPEINTLYGGRELRPYKVVLVDGTGKGQIRDIKELYATFLTVSEPFNPVPDVTTRFLIRAGQAQGLALGEPSKVFNQTSRNIRRVGSNYEVQYQLEILGGSQEEVLCLYAVTKAILYAQKTLLEDQGIINLKMTGSDLAPRADFVPDEIYQRVLTLSFTYPFHFLQEFEAASKLILRMIPHDPYTPITPKDAVVEFEIPLE